MNTDGKPVASPHVSADAGAAAAAAQPSKKRSADAVVCERCSAEMFRMHAVWRCPVCGYKTDCCGW